VSCFSPQISHIDANVSASESHNEPNVIIEAFETSPTTEQALSAKGALQWDFPGVAVSVPDNVLDNPEFQKRLAAFLDNASREHLDQVAVKVRKAGVEISEDRNTVHPAIITQSLMTLLEVNGEWISLPVLRKRVKMMYAWIVRDFRGVAAHFGLF
jgi:hypothetical protein